MDEALFLQCPPYCPDCNCSNSHSSTLPELRKTPIVLCCYLRTVAMFLPRMWLHLCKVMDGSGTLQGSSLTLLQSDILKSGSNTDLGSAFKELYLLQKAHFGQILWLQTIVLQKSRRRNQISVILINQKCQKETIAIQRDEVLLNSDFLIPESKSFTAKATQGCSVIL